MDYKASDGETYQLNFIDTPGTLTSLMKFLVRWLPVKVHCCGRRRAGRRSANPGKLLHRHEMDLEVVPVLNKIDLPAADPNAWRKKLKILSASMPPTRCAFSENRRWRAGRSRTSGARHSPPEGDPEGPLQALIIDSWFTTTWALFHLSVLKTAPCVRAQSESHEYRADL